MVILQTGEFGVYYGSPFNYSQALSFEQQQVNAYYIYQYFKSKGWTLNAIAGMLGNMDVESSLNPGRWQSDNVGNTSGGYGLVQWTPASNYIEWCKDTTYDPSELDAQLNKIFSEFKHGGQWYPTDEYNHTFLWFSQSTEPVEYLTIVFLKCYERAGVEAESYRQELAMLWYEYLLQFEDGSSPTLPDNPDAPIIKIKKKRFKFHLFKKKGITRK